MNRVCFVTNELHPFSPGGIGRLMHNFAVYNRDYCKNRALLYFLVPFDVNGGVENIAQYFRDEQLGIVFSTVSDFTHLSPIDNNAFKSAPRDGYDPKSFIRRSQEYYHAIRKLSMDSGIDFDYIEFPDFGGWGYSSIMAKLAGDDFARTKLVTRLHSTSGVIDSAEPFFHPRNPAERFFFDMERQCLKYADIVIAHSSAVSKANRTLYSFDEEWEDRVVLQLPPILLNEDELVTNPGLSESKDFLFSSRLQPVKRPDLYIRAAIHFINLHPSFNGKFYVATFGIDKNYIDWLIALVPNSLRERIPILLNPSQELRSELLRSCTVVIPSIFESYCVFAFECLLRGNKVILNAQCPPFGQSDFWKHSENCLTFNGTVAGLVKCFEESLAWNSPTKPILPIPRLFWESENELPGNHEGSSNALKASADSNCLTLIVFGFENVFDVNFAMHRNVFETTGALIKVIFAVEQYLLDEVTIEAAEKEYFVGIQAKYPTIFEAHNIAQATNGTFVLFMDHGSTLSPLFVDYLARMNAASRFEIVSCHRLISSSRDVNDLSWQDGDRDQSSSVQTLKVDPGEARFLADYSIDHFSSEVAWRRTFFIDFSSEWISSLMPLVVLTNRAVRGGARTLTIPRVLLEQRSTEFPKPFTETGLLDSFSRVNDVVDYRFV